MNKTIEELVCVVDGVKSINFEVLEQQYGIELVEEITPTFEHFIGKNWEWDFKKLEENEYSAEFVMFTPNISRIYEFGKTHKDVKSFVIGAYKCEFLLDLMRNINEAKKS